MLISNKLHEYFPLTFFSIIHESYLIVLGVFKLSFRLKKVQKSEKIRVSFGEWVIPNRLRPVKVRCLLPSTPLLQWFYIILIIDLSQGGFKGWRRKAEGWINILGCRFRAFCAFRGLKLLMNMPHRSADNVIELSSKNFGFK